MISSMGNFLCDYNPPPMTTSNANRQIARAAGTVMIAILFGQLAGLVRGMIVARAFGASPELDAFFAANRVSETLFLLVAGGALGSAFIPTFTGLLAKDERDSAWRLASSLANAVTLILSLLAVISAIFAPQIVRYALAPGLSCGPRTFFFNHFPFTNSTDLCRVIWTRRFDRWNIKRTSEYF